MNAAVSRAEVPEKIPRTRVIACLPSLVQCTCPGCAAWLGGFAFSVS
jgi:hypothetical protein